MYPDYSVLRFDRILIIVSIILFGVACVACFLKFQLDWMQEVDGAFFIASVFATLVTTIAVRFAYACDKRGGIDLRDVWESWSVRNASMTTHPDDPG